jgi:hypothetical protein
MANRSVRPARAPNAVAILAVASLCPIARADEPVSFNRDIRPIMSNTCFHCHGNDATTREAGMRLDVRDAALVATDGGVVPIVPRDPESSEIIKRIFDNSDPMPPESAHKPLTAEQKALFRRWVAEGAVHDLHATMLALLGIDHHRLTTKFQGLDVRLTGIAGNVVKGIMA